VFTAERLVHDIQQARLAGEDAQQLREELWDNCQEVVGSLATRYTRLNPHWRDDITAEAYLKFEQALVSYDPERGVPFRGFLSGCIQRMCIDRLRRKAEAAIEYADELPDDRGDSIDAHLCLEELSHHVHETLESVLPNDRARLVKILAFRLRHMEGWPVEEIREVLGVECANTVSQWIHRVRRAFEAEFPRRYPDYFAADEDGAER
jgi:RNA polymerase sigma factor (sigma-70 family)